MVFFYHLTNRKIMSQKAPNGDATGASEEQCMICQKTTSNLLSCCGNPLCKSCFEGITQLRDDKKKPPICPNCQKPITALIPIVPILQQDGDATGASEDEIKRIQAEKLAKKRAEIAARVAKARQEQEQMKQLVSIFSNFETALSSYVAENPRLQRIHEVRASLKRNLDDPTSTPEKFLERMDQACNEAQKEFAADWKLWQHEIACWDFNPKQLLQILEQMRKLPPGTPILSPLSGRGFLEACLQRLGLVVICNDLEKPADGFTFVDASQISQRDGLDFLRSYHAGNPDTPFAILVSWAPQKGHPGSEISEKIFRFASECPTSVGVFHISEGNQDDGNYGCTDTEEAFVVIEEHFNRLWRVNRQKPIWKKTDPSHLDIADYLSWRVPRRGSKK
jgi:hypothetical protein